MTVGRLSRTPGSPIPSLAELAELIQTDGSLTMRRRQEMQSGLRLVGRALGRRLEEIPASPGYLRERFAELSPAMVGVSAGRWNNTQSLLRAALKLAGLARIPGRSTQPLGPEWQDLFRYLNERRMREALSRFARYCTVLGILPTEVSDSVAADFLRGLENEGIIRNPRKVHRAMCIAWNRAATLITAWPSTRLMVPQYRQSYSLAWDAFPTSLREEVKAYFDRLSGKDILAELDFRPLRPATIQSYDHQLREFLSALVHRGHDPRALQSLADVVRVEVFKMGLRFFIDRARGARTKHVHHLAQIITAIARHWVKVEKDHLDQLRAICRRLDPGKGRLTEKNQNRLRQFDDRAHLQALLTLPQRIVARQAGRRNPSHADALEV